MRWVPAAVVSAAVALTANGAAAAEQPADEVITRGVAQDAADAKDAAMPPPPGAAEDLARAGELRKERRPPAWGLLVGGGFPEGLAASVVFRPVSEVRLFAGPIWNYVGWGVQGGVTLVPWHMGISPTLSLSAGRYFSADASFLAGNSSGVPDEVKPLLGSVSYDFVAGHVGVEIGTRDAFAITVDAGLSYVTFVARGTTTTAVDVNGTPATVQFTDPHLRGTMPSVKVGIQLWF
ncbi:MAG TPA: hypothetical protein VFL83_07920 [Anaeromyxobacter sp.]|nr:hypothetical protein [Anaeromyxobacter sp.]